MHLQVTERLQIYLGHAIPEIIMRTSTIALGADVDMQPTRVIDKLFSLKGRLALGGVAIGALALGGAFETGAGASLAAIAAFTLLLPSVRRADAVPQARSRSDVRPMLPMIDDVENAIWKNFEAMESGPKAGTALLVARSAPRSNLMVRGLRGLGYRVVLCSDPAQVLDAVADGDKLCDMLIYDFDMGGDPVAALEDLSMFRDNMPKTAIVALCSDFDAMGIDPKSKAFPDIVFENSFDAFKLGQDAQRTTRQPVGAFATN